MYNLKPEFTFNKGVNLVKKRIIIAEFVAKRNEVCELLNPNYEKWNEEFSSKNNSEVDENDPLKDYGGTEYCKFITSKQRSVIKKYENSSAYLAGFGVRIKVDETGDLYGVIEKDGIEVRLTLH